MEAIRYSEASENLTTTRCRNPKDDPYLEKQCSHRVYVLVVGTGCYRTSSSSSLPSL